MRKIFGMSFVAALFAVSSVCDAQEAAPSEPTDGSIVAAPEVSLEAETQATPITATDSPDVQSSISDQMATDMAAPVVEYDQSNVIVNGGSGGCVQSAPYFQPAPVVSSGCGCAPCFRTPCNHSPGIYLTPSFSQFEFGVNTQPVNWTGEIGLVTYQEVEGSVELEASLVTPADNIVPPTIVEGSVDASFAQPMLEGQSSVMDTQAPLLQGQPSAYGWSPANAGSVDMGYNTGAAVETSNGPVSAGTSFGTYAPAPVYSNGNYNGGVQTFGRVRGRMGIRRGFRR